MTTFILFGKQVSSSQSRHRRNNNSIIYSFITAITYTYNEQKEDGIVQQNYLLEEDESKEKQKQMIA